MKVALAAGLAVALIGIVSIWQYQRYRERRAWADAEQSLARHDLNAAAAHLESYLAMRPDDAAAWFQAARTARRRGRFADAKQDLAEFERLGGSADAVQLERDLILVQQGLIGEIDVRLRSTIEPDHPEARYVLEALARGYLAVERWADARQACRLWRAIEPDAYWPWLWGGWISERMAQLEQAAEFYRRAFELNPEDRDVRVALGRLLLRQRTPGVAIDHYRWVVERFPEDSEAALGLAQCQIDLGRTGEAVPGIEQVLKREPASQAAIALRGRAAMESGDPNGAEQWLRQAVQGDPSDAESLHLLVLALRALQHEAEANELGTRLEKLRQDLKRLTELMRLIGPQLEEGKLCHEAGVIALRIGRTQQGLNYLVDALRRKGDHRPTHAALASYYRSAGKLEAARHHQTLADAP